MDTKRLILLVPRSKASLAAPTFYVDVVDGDDSDDGLTLATAWKTVPKVNAAALVGDDHVLFKRGQTHPGKINLTRDGTAGHKIYYDAYGIGDDPIIDGTAEYSALYGDSVSYISISNLDFAGSNRDSTFYLNAVHDIDVTGCTVRDSFTNKSGLVIDGDSYNVTVDGCLVKDNYRSGVLAADINLQNVLIKNTISEYNGHSVSADHGMYIAGGVTVETSTARFNSGGGFKLNDNGDVAPFTEPFYYPTLRSSIAHDNEVGLILTHKNATAYNNLFYGNVVNIEAFGNTWGGYKCYFNTVINATSPTYRSAILFSAGVSANSEFKNNIFVQDLAVAGITKGIIHLDVGLDMSSYAAMFDWNTYYMNGSTTDTKFLYTPAALKNWNDWVAAGAEANGTYLATVPEFVTRYTDMQPMEGGNLVGLGVAIIGYDMDFNGVARTDPPTPGCYDDPQPEKVYFSSAEVGSAGKNLVRVTFSTTILAGDYSTGVTIKVNGSDATINSAARQAGNKIVQYTLSANVAAGDTVTWEYDSATGDYTNGAGTYDLQTYTAQAVTNNCVDILLDVDFEDGTFSGATVTDADGHMTVGAAGALNGTTQGVSLNFADNTSMVARWAFTASLTGVARGRIFLDPNTCAMGANNTFYLLSLENGANAVGGIEVNYNGGYDVRAYIYDDAGTPTESVRSYYTDAPHRIEVKLTRASTNVAADGRVDIWVDGAGLQSITGIDNYDRFSQLDHVKIGAEGVDTGTRGIMFVDELIVNNTGDEIGA